MMSKIIFWLMKFELIINTRDQTINNFIIKVSLHKISLKKIMNQNLSKMF